jgi:hypothetical protein
MGMTSIRPGPWKGRSRPFRPEEVERGLIIGEQVDGPVMDAFVPFLVRIIRMI